MPLGTFVWKVQYTAQYNHMSFFASTPPILMSCRNQPMKSCSDYGHSAIFYGYFLFFLFIFLWKLYEFWGINSVFQSSLPFQGEMPGCTAAMLPQIRAVCRGEGRKWKSYSSGVGNSGRRWGGAGATEATQLWGMLLAEVFWEACFGGAYCGAELRIGLKK